MPSRTCHDGVGRAGRAPRASWATGALAALLSAAAVWSAPSATRPAREFAERLDPPRYRPEGPRQQELLGADAEDLKALGKARQLALQGNVEAAFEIFQALLEKGDSTFLPAGEGEYLPMDYVVAGEMAALGEKALEAYRARYAATAAILIERAARAGDEAQLLRLANQYVHTPAGAAALERLGSLAFDRGDFPRAALGWTRLLRLRGPWPGRAMILARSAVAWHLAGRPDRAAALAAALRRQFPDAAGTVGTSRRLLAQFVDETLAASPPPSARPAVVEGWTGTGGTSGPTPADSKAGIVLATRWVNPAVGEKGKLLDLVARPTGGPARQEREDAASPPVLRKGLVVAARAPVPAMVFPVIAGDLAIYRSDSHVTACDLLTGETAWYLRIPLLREPKEPSDGGWFVLSRTGDESAWTDAGRHLMTLADGRLFVRHGIPSTISGPDTASGLAAISVGPAPGGGKLLWEVGVRTGEGFLHECQFTSAPTVRDGRLYILAYRGLKCHLLCLDAANGQLLWQRWIADAPREGGRMDMPWARMRTAQLYAYQRGSPPALAGHTVLALPNTGALIALDAATGRLLWARRYDTPANDDALIDLDDNPRPNARFAPRPPTGPINPVLVLGDRAVCLPADRANLLAFDVQDGRELWGRSKPISPAGRCLSAVDSQRILLTGLGLEVRSADTGALCHPPIDLKDVHGRPAVMGRFVLASGNGRLHRIDLATYAHSSLPLDDARGLLGNLAVSGQTLLAANSAGLCAYFEFDDACRRLDERIAKSPPAEAAALLLQRATLAFHAKAFDRAAADLDAARAAATEQLDTALLDRVGLWTLRLAVARGNHAPTPDEALAWFQKARQLASGNEDKAYALLRLAKAYDKAALPHAAVALAQELTETPGLSSALIADVPIGPGAPAFTGREADESLAPAADLAASLIAALIRRHGRDVYAGFDREAAAALEKARTDQDPAPVLAVAQRWPHSLSAAAARYTAAELYCLQALKAPDRQEDLLRDAFAQLNELTASPDPATSLRARLAIRVIRLRLAGSTPPPLLPDTLPAASTVPDGPFSFLDSQATLRAALAALRAGKLPGR